MTCLFCIILLLLFVYVLFYLLFRILFVSPILFRFPENTQTQPQTQTQPSNLTPTRPPPPRPQVSNDDRGQGGYCDVSPPTCRAAEDACVVLGPDPPFWPAADRVAFSFPAFPSLEVGVVATEIARFVRFLFVYYIILLFESPASDPPNPASTLTPPLYQGGAPAFYNWSLGTRPGLSDVVPWQPVGGEAVSRAAEVADPDGEAGARVVITQTVYLADEPLPPGVALRQGQE